MINLHTGMSVSDEHEVKNVTFSRMNGKGSLFFLVTRNGSIAMLQPQAELTPGPHMSLSSLVATYLQVWVLAVGAGGTSDPASSPVPVVEIFQFWGDLPRHWEEPAAHEGWPGSSRHFEAPLTHLGAGITEKCHKMWVVPLSGSLFALCPVCTLPLHSVWTELNCSQPRPRRAASSLAGPSRGAIQWPLSSCWVRRLQVLRSPSENMLDENQQCIESLSDGLGREEAGCGPSVSEGCTHYSIRDWLLVPGSSETSRGRAQNMTNLNNTPTIKWRGEDILPIIWTQSTLTHH